MATWFELPASHLDELTPGKYTWITLGAHTPTNRVNRKPSTFSCCEIQFRSVNTGCDAQILSG
jgi:hypothetical protein